MDGNKADYLQSDGQSQNKSMMTSKELVSRAAVFAFGQVRGTWLGRKLATSNGTLALAAAVLGGAKKEDGDAGFARCQVLAKLGRYDEALEQLARLVAHDPGHVNAILTMGQIQAHLAQYGEAIETFRTAWKVDPANDIAIKSLADLLPTVGQPELAIELCRDFLNVHPDRTDIWRTLGQACWKIEADGTQISAAGSEGAVPQLEEPLGEETGVSQASPQAEIHGLDDGGADISEELRLARARVSELRDGTEKLAELVASQNHNLGMLDSMTACVSYGQTQHYMRNLGLYMERFGQIRAIPEAPRKIPASLQEKFSMRGRIRTDTSYMRAGYLDIFEDIYTEEDLDRFIALFSSERSSPASGALAARSYASVDGQTDSWAVQALSKRGIKDHDVAVYGSNCPYYEAFCVTAGAKPTTIRKRRVVNRSSRFATMTVDEWEAAPVTFDVVIAISTVAREGLGLSDEPLDPDADLSEMRRFKRMVKQGGILVLAVPVGLDCVLFNARRIYGEVRLPLLLEGWKVNQRIGYQDELLTGSGEVQPVYILENT